MNVASSSPSSRKQKRLGPAPIASMEDTSAEEKAQVGTGTLQDSGVLGFREEDTLDLRNSTEELQFMEPEKGNREKEKPNTQINYGSCPTQRYSPIIWKLEEQPSQSQYQYQHQQQQQHNRKDSASSEQQQHLPRKKRTSTASNESTTLGGRYDQTTDQPTASANSTPSKQKLVLKMFKSKRDPKSKSPSPMGSAADGIGQSFSNSPGYDQHTKSNIAAARSPGSTGLRYYDTPLDGQSIHIPLHTPPEERRLGSFRSAAGQLQHQEEVHLKGKCRYPLQAHPQGMAVAFKNTPKHPNSNALPI
uniref:Uncharacterized protein n=1 Tax=Anopheles coluzzii TaxID=1518534 RepID=A0A8W7P039_ANOCL